MSSVRSVRKNEQLWDTSLFLSYKWCPRDGIVRSSRRCHDDVIVPGGCYRAAFHLLCSIWYPLGNFSRQVTDVIQTLARASMLDQSLVPTFHRELVQHQKEARAIGRTFRIPGPLLVKRNVIWELVSRAFHQQDDRSRDSITFRPVTNYSFLSKA